MEDDWWEYRTGIRLRRLYISSKSGIQRRQANSLKDPDVLGYLHEMNMATGTTHFITGPCDMTADLLSRDSATGLSRKHTGEIYSDIGYRISQITADWNLTLHSARSKKGPRTRLRNELIPPAFAPKTVFLE